MPYIKDQPLTEEEQTLWDKLVTQCKKVNEAIDKGYILINRHGDLLKGKFVFESGIGGSHCIAMHEDGTGMWAIFVHKTAMTTHGSNTYLEEYKATEKLLATIRVIPNDETIHFFDL